MRPIHFKHSLRALALCAPLLLSIACAPSSGGQWCAATPAERAAGERQYQDGLKALAQAKVDDAAETKAAAGKGPEAKAAFLAADRALGHDLQEAYRSFREAAELGHALAQYELYRRYSLAEGVNFDRVEADKWLHRAMSQGIEVPSGRCAVVAPGEAEYRKGEKATGEEARAWFQRAAALDYPPALDALGDMYAFPREYSQEDRPKGCGYYRRSAARGSLHGSSMLDQCYRLGWLKSEVVEKYERAAANGDKSAYAALGSIYEEGRGVRLDLDQARTYYRLAGCAACLQRLDDQLLAAKRRADEAARKKAAASRASAITPDMLAGGYQSMYGPNGRVRTPPPARTPGTTAPSASASGGYHADDAWKQRATEEIQESERNVKRMQDKALHTMDQRPR